STSMKTFRAAARVSLCVCVAASSARAATIILPASGNLQAAINDAQPGDTIALEAGATYTGNFKLPAKSGNKFITIRTGADAALPGEGARISPQHANLLAKIRSGSGSPAFETLAGAHHWRLQLLEIQATSNGGGDILRLGDGSQAQNSLEQIPNNLVV